MRTDDTSLNKAPEQPEPERLSEFLPVDSEPSEADIAVDAALGDLVRCAYHDRWLRARLQIVEDHIRDLRCENAQLRGDLAAAYCRMDDMEGYNDD
mgnify:CR=1 FL=1